MSATHKCERCQTEYFSSGECDWCPGMRRIPILAKRITDPDFKYTPAIETDVRKTFEKAKG